MSPGNILFPFGATLKAADHLRDMSGIAIIGKCEALRRTAQLLLIWYEEGKKGRRREGGKISKVTRGMYRPGEHLDS